MTIEIKVPALGESVTEATVAKWLKSKGDAVGADEPLVELETDKVSLEVNAPAAGTLSEIEAEAGAEVEVGAILGRIEEGADPADDGADAEAAEPEPEPEPESEPEPVAAEGRAGPAARKLAAEAGLAIETIEGTGSKGTVTKGDVEKAITARDEAPAKQEEGAEPKAEKKTPAEPVKAREPAAKGREERVRMTRLRRRIAERLKEAQNTAAMLTTFNECDMSAVMEMRNRHQDAFVKKYGLKLGFMSFFVKAVIEALRATPAVNAEIDGDEIVYKHYYDIGVAVSTEAGLVVPVLRGADGMTFAAIEQAIADLGKRARDGKLAMEELQGGTFTISNGGIFGSLMSAPILNPPQVGILGMHKIQQRPMVMANGHIEARPMMYLALSYDHRIVDGREAVTFLVKIKDCIENPERILLEI